MLGTILIIIIVINLHGFLLFVQMKKLTIEQNGVWTDFRRPHTDIHQEVQEVQEREQAPVQMTSCTGQLHLT